MPGRRRSPSRTRVLRGVVAAAVLLAALTIQQALHDPATDGSDRQPGAAGTVVVDHVVDGDTLVVRDRAGARVSVRTVQIDAPENSALRYGRPDACGAAATRYAHTLTRPGSRVTLEASGRDRRDRYGRSLALVHLGGPDATTWQQRMVAAGWADVDVYRGNRTRLLGVLRRTAADAREHHRGVYGRCGGRFHAGGVSRLNAPTRSATGSRFAVDPGTALVDRDRSRRPDGPGSAVRGDRGRAR